MLYWRCRILAETISIASTPLQQRQSISLALFLKCPHMHQLRCSVLKHQQLKREYAQFISHGSHYHTFFSIQTQTEMVNEWLSERLYGHIYFPQKLLSSLIYKSDIVFLVFLSLDQNLMKLEKHHNVNSQNICSLFTS